MARSDQFARHVANIYRRLSVGIPAHALYRIDSMVTTIGMLSKNYVDTTLSITESLKHKNSLEVFKW